MIEELNENCHYPLTKGEYFIYDDNKNNKPLFLTEDAIWNLKILNASETNVHFFQNDNCLMTNNQLKKCDWICVFQNEFYFIEAKDVANAARRKKQRRDAVEKFEATISYFFESYPDIKKMSLFIIMNFRNPKITRAANKARESYFDEIFNAKYIETNILNFN